MTSPLVPVTAPSEGGTGGVVEPTLTSGMGGEAGAPEIDPEESAFVCPYTMDPTGYCYLDVTGPGPDGYEVPEEARGPINAAPRGEVLRGTFDSPSYGERFPYAVYIPAQYDGSAPATLHVFQDMEAYVSDSGRFRVPQVFDNLIHSGEIPVTVGIFHAPSDCEIPEGMPEKYCRDMVYNRATAAYANFVVDELIPHVVSQYGLNLISDPAGRACVGSSAGGAAALGVVWYRPDAFEKAITHGGSFVPIAQRIGDPFGAEMYLTWFREADKTLLRLTMASGPNDNTSFMRFEANIELAKILQVKGNHYRFSIGDGSHGSQQSGQYFPDDLRWMWKEYR